jgi:aminoglycoside phosphotransferase
MAAPSGAQLVLKHQRAPAGIMKRYRFLSEFNLQREALALAALRGAGIPVPAVIGFHENPDAIAIECVPGTGDLASLPAGPARCDPMGAYARTLATLHQLDWRQLGLDAHMPVPTSETLPTAHGPLGASVEDFRRFRSALLHPEPLLDLALWWLEHHPPARPSRVSFLHGDAGVNQFMVHDGHMTAVLDWELSHLGDPMWEFGNARYRETLYPSGTFGTFLCEYAAHAASPLDRTAILYYTVAACMTMLLPISVNVHRPRVRNPESLAQLWWDALTRALLCDALLEAMDAAAVPAPEPWPQVGRAHESPTARFLVERLASQTLTLEAADVRKSLQGSRLLAEVVELEMAYGRRLEAETLDDVGGLVGARSADLQSALAQVEALVHESPGEHLAAVITVFGRLARRRMRLLAPLAHVDSWGDSHPDPGPFSEAAYTLPLLPDWL